MQSGSNAFGNRLGWLGTKFSTLGAVIAVAARMSNPRWEESSVWAGGPAESS